MNQKSEKPTLSGQRIKTRKRDEKEKYDPVGFRDSVLQGLEDAGTDVEQISKYLDVAGAKLDYRRYGETLFDILIAGGILAPGGSLVEDAGDNNGRKFRTDACIFMQEDTMDKIRPFALVFIKLMRRYKYLEKMFEEEVKKVLLFLRGFSEKDRHRLSKALAVWISQAAVPPSCLTSLLQEHLVRDGLSSEFIVELMVAWKHEKDIQAVKSALKKAGLESKLMQFFPMNKRNKDHFHALFKDNGLAEIVEFHLTQANAEVKKELQVEVDRMVQDGDSPKEIVTFLKLRNELEEREIVGIVWNGVMSSVEWNKKEELVAEQALKHLKVRRKLHTSFCRIHDIWKIGTGAFSPRSRLLFREYELHEGLPQNRNALLQK
ncbi:unnamed protein product [Cyprideis torosa]|uniref:5MP1/2-like HEAT domain-containing protein n=1 Tax=Cyprideis torosa TaxID=163714 RepID=A0A7R8W2L7_9CRUS|nr:unnamed protein product [Cyprideis torosa]CAG0879901.1 unnamed protein product [Cyprideis torosa]